MGSAPFAGLPAGPPWGRGGLRPNCRTGQERQIDQGRQWKPKFKSGFPRAIDLLVLRYVPIVSEYLSESGSSKVLGFLFVFVFGHATRHVGS